MKTLIEKLEKKALEVGLARESDDAIFHLVKVHPCRLCCMNKNACGGPPSDY